MDYEGILKYFKHRYKIIEDDLEHAFYFNTDKMRVGVFDYDYPNTGYCGKILLEHKKNFDKWSKAFYRSNFPGEAGELLLIESDIKYFSDELNEHFGNNFGVIERYFRFKEKRGY